MANRGTFVSPRERDANLAGVTLLDGDTCTVAGEQHTYDPKSDGSGWVSPWPRDVVFPEDVVGGTFVSSRPIVAPNKRWSIIGQANRISSVVAGHTAASSRVAFHTVTPFCGIKAVFRNAIASGTSVNETSMNQYLGPLTIVGAYLEIGAQTIPLTFGGSLTATIPVGGEIEHDPVYQYIAPGTVGYYRTDVQIASGKQMPGQGGRYAIDEGVVYDGAAIGSGTGIAGYTASTGDVHFAPWSVMGLVLQDTYITIGDSIPFGAGDNGYTPGAAVGPACFGWARRWLYSQRGHSACCFPGGTIGQWNDPTLAPTTRRYLMRSGATHLTLSFGVNDIAAGRTYAQLVADFTAAVRDARSAGFLRVGVVKILPKTTSTDSFATTANQTPAAGHEAGGIRGQINAWFDSSRLFDYVIDWYKAATVVTLVEGKGWVWAPLATTDGVNPNTNAHAALAAACPDPKSIGIYST